MKKHLLMIVVAAAFGCEGKAKDAKPAASTDLTAQARDSKEPTRSKEEPKADLKHSTADEDYDTSGEGKEGHEDEGFHDPAEDDAAASDENVPCQKKFSPEETRERDQYLQQCTQALARATACIKDPAFGAALSAARKGWGPNAKKALAHAKQAFGTHKTAVTLCKEMMRDLTCEAAARDWGNAWEPGSFDEMLAASEDDCAAIATATPERPVRAD